MESPETIYLQVEIAETVIKTWDLDKKNAFDIEYIRADIVEQNIKEAYARGYNLGDKEAEERVRLEIQ